MDIQSYWQAVLQQNRNEIREFFHADAHIKWHNTNECFSVEEFIRANCEYPGKWDGTIERVEIIGNLVITISKVYSTDKPLSFHVVSFIEIREGRIVSVDEYWGDNGQVPQWRLDKKIGRPIV